MCLTLDVNNSNAFIGATVPDDYFKCSNQLWHWCFDYIAYK